MNPSTALAAVLVDELVRGGVTDAVVSPGSRSAPVALALAAAERAGRLRLHVRIDERTAAFLALGLAKVSGTPVPVLTTSGTAVAHLHAAVLEADASGVPLLVLTADRPPELRGTGANQTIEQPGIYTGAVRLAVDAGVPEAGREEPQNRYWRALVSRVLLVARGAVTGDPGPVQLNLPFREPLLPAAPPLVEGPWAGRTGGAPWTSAAGSSPGHPPLPEGPERTLVVVGDAPPALGRAAAELAARRGWPLVAEPSSGAWGAALRGGSLLLGVESWLAAHRPERVLVVGRPTLARPVSALLASPGVRVEVVPTGARWADAGRNASAVGGLPDADGPAADPAWLAAWTTAAERVGSAVDDVLDATPTGTARLARDVVAAAAPGTLLVLGSSTPVREVDRLAVPRGDVAVLANRGIAGIDGTVSTAVGAALAHRSGPTVALLGDLTVLHDLTGLLPGEGEPRPDLTLVVPDNDGGAIFAQLEPGRPEHARDFRRVFGTPHGRDLAAVARSLGWPAEQVAALPAVSSGTGPRLLVVATDAAAEAALAVRLRESAAAVLG